MISIKTPEEIKILREGGKILASVLLSVAGKAKPGAAAAELDELAEKLIRKAGGEPAFKNYKTQEDKIPFPSSLCVSVNDEVVHGIPSPERILREGDIAGLDLGLKWRNLYTDAALSVPVGKISREAKELLVATKKALEKGIKAARAGGFVGDVSFAVQSYVEARGFNVVKKLVGHGVGYGLHEEPEIPNWGNQKTGAFLKEGMVIAVEPMAVSGSSEIYLAKNNWTWKTKDGSLAAHFEHTIAITKRGCEVLTIP